MAVHCTECGFVAGEGANYCPKCGAFLGGVGGPDGPITAAYQIGNTGEIGAVAVPESAPDSTATLVVRTGGGREGDSFALSGDRIAIGRRPESGVFLDDVTVSRDHAMLVARADGWHVDDLGSLNGTYVNRHRIESVLLQEGDELQVGKFRLGFLGRQ